MKLWETADSFPFKTLRGLGCSLLGLGVSVLILGAFDVIWTVVYYTDDYEDCPDRDDWDSNLELPCDVDELVWTWTAEGLWGGFLILLVGILGLLFSRWRVRSLRLQRDMFGIGCILLIFPVCPAIIALSVLEIYFGLDIFYYTEDNELVTEDVAKFVVPLLTGFLAFLSWIMAIAGASVACCCASIVIEETTYGDKQPIVAQQQLQVQQQPQQQLVPAIMAPPQQQQPQYEIVAIAQPPPPPFFVSAPLGAPPPFLGPPGPPMMGPPMPFGPYGPPPFRPPRGRPGPPLPMLMPPPDAYI